MIEIKNLEFKYKTGDKVLKNINLSINDGECIAIVGKNGSGKSTLSKLISGINRPSSGKILIDGLDISNKKNLSQIRKNISIVFQNPENQIIFSNIYDEVSFSLKDLSKEEIRKTVKESMEKVDMLEYIDKDLYELSLGQKQRVAIAEALCKKPKIIIFDEPTSMLDSMGKDKILDIIKGLKQEGYTIIYNTNIAEEIFLAGRIIVLESGKIEEINKDKLLNNLDKLKESEIKIPFVLELLLELKKININIDINFSDYTMSEIVNKIEEGFKSK